MQKGPSNAHQVERGRYQPSRTQKARCDRPASGVSPATHPNFLPLPEAAYKTRINAVSEDRGYKGFSTLEQENRHMDLFLRLLPLCVSTWAGHSLTKVKHVAVQTASGGFESPVELRGKRSRLGVEASVGQIASEPWIGSSVGGFWFEAKAITLAKPSTRRCDSLLHR